MSTIGRSKGYTLIARSAGKQPLVGEAGEEAVDGPFEVRDVSLEPAPTGACTRSPSRAGPSAGAAGSRSPARGSAATADRRTPTRSGGVGVSGSLPSGNRVERPDLHQRLLRPQRAEAVRRRAAVHRQHEVVREAVEERLVDPARVELVEVGDVGARGAVPAHDRVVERAVPRRHRERRVGGQLDVAQTLGDAHVVRVHHPVHAVAHRAQVVDLRVDERTRVERTPSRARVPSRDDELGMRLARRGTSRRTPRCASFQFTGRRHAYHHSVRSDSTFHASRIGRGRLDALPQRRRVVVEVDPRAPAPHLAPHRHEVDVVGLQVVLGERLRAA